MRRTLTIVDDLGQKFKPYIQMFNIENHLRKMYKNRSNSWRIVRSTL